MPPPVAWRTDSRRRGAPKWGCQSMP
jgi:hypothetical protein